MARMIIELEGSETQLAAVLNEDLRNRDVEVVHICTKTDYPTNASSIVANWRESAKAVSDFVAEKGGVK